MSRSTRRERGFTLVELLLTISIILVIGTFSASFYSNFIGQNATSNAVDQLVGEFRKAQIYAMMGKANTSWGVSFGSNTITLFATGKSAFNETFSVPSTVSISGFTQVTFARVSGIPDSSPTITISSGIKTKTITLNSQGVASH